MARRDVFADTSGLYALVDKRDGHHRVARDVVRRIVLAGRKLVITDYVIDETLTLAKARSGAHVALRVLDLVDQSGGLRIEWVGAARFEAARQFFRRQADHEYSFTDCSSFVVMRELKLREALTSDGHFPEAGFEALLPVL